MKKKLYESLKHYKRLNRSSFHTPGHKMNVFGKSGILSLDYTELPLTDSLYEASGIIKQAENDLKKLYGSKESIFSSGGNTLCIQTMLALAAKNKEKILCDRLVHRSAVSAMALLDIDPIWVKREYNKKSRLFEKIDLKDLKEKLNEKVDYKAFYTTSPSYHGIIQNISLISEECKKKSVPVLVDNAHGSHLKFVGGNLHPLDMGAAMSADSAHKTLPVLTGGAWLHVNDDRFCEDVKNKMALFGSTSPSYVVMSSMDIARDWLKNCGEKEFLKLKSKVENIKNLAKEKGIFIPDESISDPVRITLGVWKAGYSGFEFREYLYKYGVEPEFCDSNYTVLIATPFNTREDFKKLKKALKEMKVKEEKKLGFEFNFKIPEKLATIREAIMAKSVKVNINNCVGKIAADVVCPCPPGVPVVMPGEKISDYEYEVLRRYGISKINVLK